MSIVFNKHNPKSFVVRGEIIENLKSRQNFISQLSGKCVYNTRLKFGSGLLVPINETNEKILQKFGQNRSEFSDEMGTHPSIESDLTSEKSLKSEQFLSVEYPNSKDKETNRLHSVMIPYQETINDEPKKNIETNSVLKQTNIKEDSNSLKNIDDLLLKLINDSDNEDSSTAIVAESSETIQQSKDRETKDTNTVKEVKIHTFNIVHNNLKETKNMKNKNQKKQHKEKQVSIIDNKTNSNLFKMSHVNKEKNMEGRTTRETTLGRSKKMNKYDKNNTKNTNENFQNDNDKNNTTTEESKQRTDSKKIEREDSHNSPHVSSRNAEKYDEREKREREKREREKRERERRHKRRSKHDSSSESSSETSSNSSSESSEDSSDDSEYSGDSSEDERIQKTIRRKGQRPDRRQVELNDSDVDSDHEDVVTLSRRVRYLIRKIRSIEDYLRK